MWSWFGNRSSERRYSERRRILRLLTISAEELPPQTVSDITGIASGRLYPALSWLEENGDIESRWDLGVSPRQRLYRRESHLSLGVV